MTRAASSFAASVGLALLVATLGLPRHCLAQNVGVGSEETIAAKRGKAGTMADLARMYDSGPCASCHRAIYDEWRNSAHARSIFGAGRTASALRAAVTDGLMQWPYSGVKSAGDVSVRHLMGCAKCHLPQLADAGDDAARELVAVVSEWQTAVDNNNQAAAGQAAEKLGSVNIGCLICHNRNALVHKWTDGYPKTGEIYGRKEGAHPGTDYSVLKKSPIIGESILCGQCHGLGPNLELENPTQCATIYGSYLYTYKSQGGTASCQDCHMRNNKLGHATRKTGSDPATARQAIEISTDARGFQWRDLTRLVPRVDVEVAMTNRAGHSLPGSGSTQKRLVLDVSARTSDGDEVFAKSKTYMPIAQRFGRGGRTGLGPHEKTGFVEDTALPAGKTVRERYDIVLEPREPAQGKEKKTPLEVTVNVKLRLVDFSTASADSSTWYEAAKVVKFEDAQ